MGSRLFALAAFFLAGCSRFAAAGDHADGGVPTADSSADVTSPSTDAGSAPPDGQFEGDGDGCGVDWTANGAQLSRGAGRTSTHSCRLCENSGSQGTALDMALHLADQRVVSGRKTVIGSVWIRVVTPAAGVAVGQLHFQLYDAEGRDLGVVGTGTSGLTADWRQLSFEGVVDGAALDILIGAQVAAGVCVEVDDLVFRLLP